MTSFINNLFFGVTNLEEDALPPGDYTATIQDVRIHQPKQGPAKLLISVSIKTDEFGVPKEKP